MDEIKFKFVLGCGDEEYLSDVVKTLDEIIDHTYLLDELVDDGGCKQGNIAYNDAFIEKDWVIKRKLRFTGRQDDKGFDIYEGDLIYYEYGVSAFTIREVKFENSGFVAVRTNEYGDILSDRFSVLLYENGCRNVEIRGNIHRQDPPVTLV